MSCPARLSQDSQEPVDLNILRHDSNFGLNFSDLRRVCLVATMKTLSMLFIYFLFTSPLYMSAIVLEYTDSNTDNCKDEISIAFKVICFYFVFIVGLVIYPFVWLLLDKPLAKKMLTIMKRSFDNMKYKVECMMY